MISWGCEWRKRETAWGWTEKKKRGRDSHAEQYEPFDGDSGLWMMATGVIRTFVLDDDGAHLINLTFSRIITRVRFFLPFSLSLCLYSFALDNLSQFITTIIPFRHLGPRDMAKWIDGTHGYF